MKDKHHDEDKLKVKQRDKSERVRRRQKGLPPTAPPMKMPNHPQTDREKIVGESDEKAKENINKEIEARKDSKDNRNEVARKRRKNPKTTEVQAIEPRPHRYQMYRLHSRGKQATNLESKRYYYDFKFKIEM